MSACVCVCVCEMPPAIYLDHAISFQKPISRQFPIPSHCRYNSEEKLVPECIFCAYLVHLLYGETASSVVLSVYVVWCNLV